MRKKRSNKQYASALYEVAEHTKGKHLDAILKKFVEILVRDRRLKKFENVIVEYEKLAQKQAGITALSVYSARSIGKATLERINTAFGGKTAITENIEQELLGGIKIKTDDKILDASLKKQLEILKQKLS
ncbi:MAG: ATP synthase F1 subunit delta [Candidatus Magasanikbacteria bacterium RIFOXYD2_FULL_41_14]|uniref:ATP synthase subunit delta n=1 Tax=Candidatus Magasanikbacteria bacterium RIFOXYD2_FULL_41_14 TaxID=1798709 RepID=A0A1F6PCF3_9BACT|nr:MAG: ATP synthase F1 subunit delta [Candidatus Magasanikbacteria bacterium RIFOXYD2_FULL_41_14]